MPHEALVSVPLPRNGPIEIPPPPIPAGPNGMTVVQKKLVALERERACIVMKRDGHTTATIARKLKLTYQQVESAIKNALERTAKTYTADLTQLRLLELERLDGLHRMMVKQLKSKDVPSEIAQGAVDRLIKIHDRRVKLTGLDREPEQPKDAYMAKAEAIMAPLLRDATDDELLRLREIARGVQERALERKAKDGHAGRADTGSASGDTEGDPAPEAGGEAEGSA